VSQASWGLVFESSEQPFLDSSELQGLTPHHLTTLVQVGAELEGGRERREVRDCGGKTHTSATQLHDTYYGTEWLCNSTQTDENSLMGVAGSHAAMLCNSHVTHERVSVYQFLGKCAILASCLYPHQSWSLDCLCLSSKATLRATFRR